MGHRGSLRRAIVFPVFLAILAGPAWAAPPAGKSSHYPGQKCIECHKGRVKPGERGPATTRPPAVAPGGTGATAPPTGTTPSQGVAPRR